jgi:CheY-like chemotaxis protein
MRVLVVDDDENKLTHMLKLLRDSFPEFTIEERRSYQSGLKALLLNQPDLLVLDMTMPRFDVGSREKGGRERRYAGRRYLRNSTGRRLACRS